MRRKALVIAVGTLIAIRLWPHKSLEELISLRGKVAVVTGAAGGVVCGACEAGSFPLGEAAYVFMTDALGRSLSEGPRAGEPA